MTKRIMIDIETMSTASNALVLSVGAVSWMMNKQGPIFTECREWVLDPRQQFVYGRGTSAGTLKFWMDQPASAREHWLCGQLSSIGACINGVRAICDGGDDDAEVWSNGIVFDLGNLASLSEQIGEPVPWKYNAARDARTIYRVTPRLRTRPAHTPVIGLAHTPIYDCKTQIWGLWEHWPEEDLAPVTSAGNPAGSDRSF
jgi:hypothetical protein